MNLTNSESPGRSALWKATLLFASVSGLLIAADHLAMLWPLNGIQSIVDDLLGGLIAGSIFHLYERQRLRRLRESLRIIDLMNHHIRNALQPLAILACQPAQREQTNAVQQCVRRIDWALREVLPGQSAESFVAETGLPAASARGPSISPAGSPTPPGGASGSPSPHPPAFGQWLEMWRARNEAAEPVAGKAMIPAEEKQNQSGSSQETSRGLLWTK